MGCMVEVEKVLDSWNLVPREFFVSKKIFTEISLEV
jgi:hypothetical protein